MLALYVLISAILVGASVLAHEYGHLLAARRYKMHVLEFSIGFGLPITTWTTRRGLPVTLRVIPLGGATKIGRATTTSADIIPPSRLGYIDASPAARWKVTVSGSLINLLLAWAAFSALAWTYGENDTRNIVIVPLAGLVALGLVLALIGEGILHAISGGSSGGLNSILGLPTMIQDGVQTVGTSHGGIAFYLLAIFGLINMSIAIGNLLPLYPLDGFRALVAVIDGARSRRAQGDYAPLTEEQLKKPALISGGLFMMVVTFVLLRDIGSYLLG